MADNRRVDFKGLRQRADFRAILAHHGLEPVGKGDQLKIRCCPFHDDHEPGCSSVNLTKRAFHCFGGGIEGNVPDFVHRLETGAGNGAVSIRQAAALEPAGGTSARCGARKPKDGPATPEAEGKACPPPPRRLLAPPKGRNGPPARQPSRRPSTSLLCSHPGSGPPLASILFTLRS
jgi:CHC2 zinc finger